MSLRYVTAAGLMALGMMAVRSAEAGSLGYVLGNGGTTLHAFNLSTPGMAGVTTLNLMGNPASLDAIDFRPLTGQLYGYDDVTDTYYIVNTTTGALTVASSMASATNSDILDIDFNPTIDRMRTVTELDENIVYNPETGTASDAATMPLAYALGDPNAGVNPLIMANGYTNSMLGVLAGSTVQYVLDANLNVLATLANNAGTLTTVAEVTLNGLTLDFGPNGGLDILFQNGMNTAYANLSVGGSSGLYTIDLNTGAASFIGNLPTGFGTVEGLAIAPVPEPSTLAMVSLAAVGLIARTALKRRRAA